MKTSELPAGSVIKFKNYARLHLFYERYESDWSDFGGSMKTIDVSPGDVITILKTVTKDEHVGQHMLIAGCPKTVYYRKETFFDMNKGCIGGVDLTVNDYYYDVLEA